MVQDLQDGLKRRAEKSNKNTNEDGSTNTHLTPSYMKLNFGDLENQQHFHKKLEIFLGKHF